MKLLVGGCLLLALAAAQDCAGLNALNASCASPEGLHRRQFFYVGGRYVDTPAVNLTRPGRVLVDQIYVEKLTPQAGRVQPYPLIFFHGGAGSGAQWLQTPDNRQGWASWFLERGYEVYLIDQISSGRSSQLDLEPSPLADVTAEAAEIGFAAPERLNWYPQARLHTQWPGPAVVGDPSFDAFVSSFVPYLLNFSRAEIPMRSAGCQLLARVGPSFVVAHSGGSTFAVLLSDECPDLVAGTVHLEPATTPFISYLGNETSPTGTRPARPWGLTFTPITYDPPAVTPDELARVTVGEDTPALRACILQSEPPRRLPNIAKVPSVILTGEASVHITYNHCVVDYLRQAGVTVDWIRLSEVGIKGNGHFLYLEKNNLDIAHVALQWIEQQAQRRAGSR